MIESGALSRFSTATNVGPAQRSLTLRPARSPSRLATLCTRGFSSFVASTAALIATGWSEPVPGRVTPACGPPPFHDAPGDPTNQELGARGPDGDRVEECCVLNRLLVRLWRLARWRGSWCHVRIENRSKTFPLPVLVVALF
jgi:hypothetical protein